MGACLDIGFSILCYSLLWNMRFVQKLKTLSEMLRMGQPHDELRHSTWVVRMRILVELHCVIMESHFSVNWIWEIGVSVSYWFIGVAFCTVVLLDNCSIIEDFMPLSNGDFMNCLNNKYCELRLLLMYFRTKKYFDKIVCKFIVLNQQLNIGF